MTDKPELEVYEPDFDEISDPESPYFDPEWYASEFLPFDHEWFDIIGDFLFMSKQVNKLVYTGKNEDLAKPQKLYIEKVKTLIAEVEFYIQRKICDPYFVELWVDFCRSYDAAGLIKHEENARAKRGKHDRGTEERRAWYARVFLLENERGNHAKGIKYDIAKFAELIRNQKMPAPPLWDELEFEKILHKDSSLSDPKLNQDLSRDMTMKTRIPYYADKVSPKFELPPFEIRFPDSI